MTDVVALPQAGSQGTVVESTRAAAEVAAAVSVARQFPRNIGAAADEMAALCSRLSVAERAFYEVPNRGAGMSIHIARELARIWGNVDYGVRELGRNDLTGESEMTVWAWDQEANVRSWRSFIQPHARMKNKARVALTDLSDIYLNNQNTGARAVREAIFNMLPGWFLADAEARLKATLRNGDGKPLPDRQKAAIERFAELGIPEERLVARVGKPSGAWQAGDLVTLARIHSSITIDGIRADEFFPEQPVDLTALPATPADPSYVAPEES